jgi:hypothetical protein
VDACAPGGRVVVSNGVYAAGDRATPGGALANRVVITNDIEVVGLNGPAVTSIVGAGPLGDEAVRCVYISAGLLEGFTLSNGHTRVSGDFALDRSGGGAHARGGRLNRCRLEANLASGDGGGTYYGMIDNCLVVTNTAVDDGGGCHAGTLRNCTVVDNEALDRGGGCHQATVRNGIVYYNRAYSGDNHHQGLWSYSCTLPDPGGSGNITNVPGFADRPGGDLRLAFGSACIDAGRDADAPGPLDLDGNARIVGAAVDMGVYEYDGMAMDTDGDGAVDVLELHADTDPQDAGSYLRITGIAPAAGGILISWSGGTDARQILECRRDLAAPQDRWVPVYTNEPPTPIQFSVLDAGATNRVLFYRVRTVSP